MILMWAKTWSCLRNASKFRDYAPQTVTYEKIETWFRQFDRRHWKHLSVFLSKVVYFSRRDTEAALISLNQKLFERLNESDISADRIVYVQFDKAASSSPAMLNILRDSARLERRGCHFLDSSDVSRVFETTNALGQGAIVYVDDFVGTGKQFARSHKRFSEYIVGNFSEFLLAPCVCEEALSNLAERGVEPITALIHLKKARPLHADSNEMADEAKNRLVELCKEIHPQEGLGFKKLATMVVFHRNAPNTVPLLLRGNLYQKPFVGILPRTTDLPIE
jgi:hypothetical protein